MDYALAKQLMDADFPQGGAGKWLGPTDKIVWRNEDRAYAPILEELIEACGDRELSIGKFEDETNHSYEWRAIVPHQDAIGHGSSATIAVARLWLALNTKGA